MKFDTLHVLLVLASILIGVLALRAHDSSVRAQALAQQRADSLNIAQESLQVHEAHRVQDSIAVADSFATLSQTVGTSQQLSTRLTHRADSLREELRAVLGGTRGQALDSLMTVTDSIQKADSVVIHAQAQQLALLWNQRAQDDSAIIEWRTLALASHDQLTAALKRSAPRFSCVGGLGAAVGVNAAAGLGVTCGVRVL